MSRILFISLSNIGDAIMTTPVLEALHDEYGDAVIDIVAGERCAEVFQHCPYRGEILLKDKRKFLRGYPDLLRQCRQHHYELVVDLRTDGFAWLLRTQRRLQKKKSTTATLHSVEQHLSVLPDGMAAGQQTQIWLSDADRQFAQDQLATIDNTRLLAIAPGCGGPEKVWPSAHFAELAKKLSTQLAGVVLLGGDGDRQYSEPLRQRLDGQLVDLTGKTTVLQAAAVIQSCRLFVGNDSGLGHVASAVQTPTLTLFGVGYPDRYRPWQTRAKWLVGANQEVANISVDAAYASALELLQ